MVRNEVKEVGVQRRMRTMLQYEAKEGKWVQPRPRSVKQYEAEEQSEELRSLALHFNEAAIVRSGRSGWSKTFWRSSDREMHRLKGERHLRGM